MRMPTPPTGGAGGMPQMPSLPPNIWGFDVEELMDVAAALERVLEITDALVDMLKSLIEVHLALKQQWIDANRAVITYYSALQNIYQTMPQLVSSYSQLGGAISETTQAFGNLATSVAEVGRTFYDFVAGAAQAGNASAIITGSISAISGALTGLTRVFSAIQEGFNAFVNVFQRAIDAVIQPLNALMNMVDNLSSSMNNFYNLMASTLTRGLDAFSNMFSEWGGSMTNLIDVLGDSEGVLGLLGNAVGSITSRFSDLTKTIIELYNLQFQTFIADLNIVLTDLMATLQPVITELTRLQQLLAVVGQVLSTVGQIVNTLLQVFAQLLNVFGSFVSTWLQAAQALAQVQETLNIIGMNLRDVGNILYQNAQYVDAYTNALNALIDVMNRANISMSALAETVRTFNQTGILVTTQNLQNMADTVNLLAERLGILPDTATQALTAFATGGEGLRQFAPTLTAGTLQVAMWQRFGMFSMPTPMMAPFAIEFARGAIGRLFPEGEAPAALVQFTQALRTLGQILQAQFAQAEPFGGRQILEDIRNILRELVTGEIGQNLRAFFRWVSTGLAEGVRAFLAGFRDFARMPQFVELGRGIGRLLYAIGAAFGDVLRNALRQFRVEDIRNFFINFAASIYAFIRAGINFIANVIRELVNFFNNIFTGGGGIFALIGSIINMFAAALALGVDMLDFAQRVGNLIASWFQNTANSLASLARTAALVQSGLQIIVGLLFAIAGVVLLTSGYGALIGIGGIVTGATLAITGFVEFMRALRRTPEQLAREYGLEDAANQVKNFSATSAEAARNLANLGLNTQNVQRATRQFGDAMTNITRQAVADYQLYKDEFKRHLEHMDSFTDSVDRASEALGTLRERVYQYIQPFFKGLSEAADAASEFSRLLRPIVPGTTFAPVAVGGVVPALRVGAMDVLFGGRLPAIGALQQMIPREMQAAAIAQTLEIIRTTPPELLAGVSPDEVRRLWQELTQAIQQDIRTVGQAIQDETEALETRLQYFEQTARLQVAFGMDAVSAATERLGASMRAAAASAYGLGAVSALLEQLRAAYPGIEQTVEYQRLLNQYMQATADALGRLGQQWVRLSEVTRRYFQVAGEGFAEMLAWGYDAERTLAGLDAMLRGRLVEGTAMLSEAARTGFRPGWENLINATRASWQSMLADIGAETRRAFSQLLAGNVEQFYEGLRQVQQRVLQLPEDYINRIRNAFSIAMRPLNYFNETVNEIRNSLSAVGAEMTLFPYILTRSIPALIDMRNQFAAAAQEAYRLGDILSFNEALRNVAQLQRQIMELLGVTGIFLPAYTPEQMLRMMVRIGMPTQQEVVELARGRMLVEPVAFRAVPIPLAQFFGLPAPAAMRLTPDVFGGYPTLFAGLHALTPEMIRQEFRERQLEGFRQMRQAAIEAEVLRDVFMLFVRLGRQDMLQRAMPLFYEMYGRSEQQILGELIRQYGGALHPQLVRSYLPMIQRVGIPLPLEQLDFTALLQRATEPQPGETITRELRAVPAEINSAVANLSSAARSIADIFHNLNLRLQAAPLTIEIPVHISAVDARSREQIQRMERSVQIKVQPTQPT